MQTEEERQVYPHFREKGAGLILLLVHSPDNRWVPISPAVWYQCVHEGRESPLGFLTNEKAHFSTLLHGELNFEHSKLGELIQTIHCAISFCCCCFSEIIQRGCFCSCISDKENTDVLVNQAG